MWRYVWSKRGAWQFGFGKAQPPGSGVPDGVLSGSTRPRHQLRSTAKQSPHPAIVHVASPGPLMMLIHFTGVIEWKT
jgi:hypothetical protein